MNSSSDDLAIVNERYAFCAICDSLVQVIVVRFNYGVSCALVDQLPKLFVLDAGTDRKQYKSARSGVFSLKKPALLHSSCMRRVQYWR